MKLFESVLFSLLISQASAHFKLDYPVARGFDEDLLINFPCGGQNSVSPNRTAWPITGGPINLNMGHDRANIQVLLSLGNDPGINFNITLLPTIQEQGLGEFCLKNVSVPAGIAKEGTNATIQVVSNGDPSGGLYNCADITFVSATSNQFHPAACSNNTGVTAVPYTGPTKNANGTDSDATAVQSVVPSATPSSTASASATHSGAANALLGIDRTMGGVVAIALGFAAAL